MGDVGSVVLRDRKHLAEDGLIIVAATVRKSTKSIEAGPEIVSRGFVYVKESEKLMEEATSVAKKALEEQCAKNYREWSTMKPSLREALSGFIYQKTKRSPMILPIIMEI